MPSMMCIFCSGEQGTVEFPTVADFIEHEKGGHVSRPVKVLPPSVAKGPSKTEAAAEEKKVQPQKAEEIVTDPLIPPLKLQYKWAGICKDCKNEVKTIEVDLGNEGMIIGYCIPCDKQLVSKKVVSIKQQLLDRIVDSSFEKHVRPSKD